LPSFVFESSSFYCTTGVNFLFLTSPIYMLTSLNIEEKEVLNVVDAYSNALTLLDDYDHGTIPKPDGIASVYQLTYEEVVN